MPSYTKTLWDWTMKRLVGEGQGEDVEGVVWEGMGMWEGVVEVGVVEEGGVGEGGVVLEEEGEDVEGVVWEVGMGGGCGGGGCGGGGCGA
jgi:hypothetical protein